MMSDDININGLGLKGREEREGEMRERGEDEKGKEPLHHTRLKLVVCA